MDHEIIIPARFDHREAAAGLRSLEQTGRSADDLAHAADSAVARFQRAHESLRAASRGFLDLHRAAGSAGDADADERLGRSIDRAVGAEDAVGPGSSEPRDVLTHRSILGGPRPESHDSREPAAPRPRAEPGRPGGRAMSASAAPAAEADGDAATRSEHGTSARGIGSLGHINRTDEASKADGRADVESPGPDDLLGRSLRITTSSKRPGHPFVEEPSRDDSPGRPRDRDGVSARDGESGVVAASPAGPPRQPASSPAPNLAPDLAGWIGGSGRSVNSRPAGPNGLGPDAPDRRSPAAALEDVSAGGRGLPDAEFDAWEAIRRMRTAVPSSKPVVARSPGESAGWSRPSLSTSQGGRESSFVSGGGASVSVIERLLREQNEMIRQDAQRAASPPISAPPPFRGGGVRMGS